MVDKKEKVQVCNLVLMYSLPFTSNAVFNAGNVLGCGTLCLMHCQEYYMHALLGTCPSSRPFQATDMILLKKLLHCGVWHCHLLVLHQDDVE